MAPARTHAGDARLVQRLREGDSEAGRQFVRDYYPGVYRYLLYLAGGREVAEDLTQETFLQAWRRLDTFQGRAPLRLWLHRIAHREFLQALRSRRPESSLDDATELPSAPDADWCETMALRDAIQKLPVEEREVVVLHYLHGYNCEEIARIVHSPAGTVKYRLSAARSHLQRELGEGDLTYLNERPALMHRWTWLPLDQMRDLEARFRRVESGALRVESPMGPDRSDRSEAPTAQKGEQRMSDPTSSGMSRRRLLEAAGTTAAAVAAAGLAGAAGAAASNEAEIIDERLTRKVTLAIKATALSDLCEQLRRETGVTLAAGPSVADEKVTLFCEKTPLREVMRQLARPFGYTWLRSQASGVSRQALEGNPIDTHVSRPGTREAGGSHARPSDALRLTPDASYRYELVQELRSQLLEEELRNRDRNEALLALEREVEKYRPYLSLSPEEAAARAQTAAPEEKALLEQLSGKGWGDIQMYFRLSPADLATLRAGETLTFSTEPKAGEQELPEEVARGVMQTWKDWRIAKRGDRLEFDTAENLPDGLPPSAVPEANARVRLKLEQSEPGQFTINESSSGFTIGNGVSVISGFPLASGSNPATRNPANAAANARLARDPALRPKVTVQPGARRQAPDASPEKAGQGSAATPADTGVWRLASGASRITTADVLEAVHRATGLPIVADFYTRLRDRDSLVVRDQALFDALNSLADTLQMRWGKDEKWLQFRSASYYDDRVKEVPNRLLSRWSEARRAHGALSLDDLVEIGQLTDAQLDGETMAEGARECWGLAEWDLARNGNIRPHLRFLASLTPEQRQAAASPAGLGFEKLRLAQQPQFLEISGAGHDDSLQSLQDLADAALHIDYTVPGRYQWRAPEDLLGPGWPALRPAAVRERTREAALQAARRLDPEATDAQITPTEAELSFIYTWNTPKGREIRWVRPNGQWGRQVRSA